MFRTTVLGPGLRALLRTPVDFLLTMAAAAAVVALAFDLVDRLRRTVRHRLSPPDNRREWALFAATQLGAGTVVALLLVGYEVLLGNAISATSVDALHFSLHPLASARLAFAVGLVLAQSVVFWSGIVAVVLMTLPWRIPHNGGVAVAGFALQALPVLAISIFPRGIGAAPSTVPALPTAFAGLACLSLAWAMAWARPRYRHASQALRLFTGALVLLIPAFVLYPSVHHFADRGLRRLIEEEYARQAKDQRPELHAKLQTVLQQIDALEIPHLTVPARTQPGASNPAFELWAKTNLATERLASSLELYDAAGRLEGRRFALNLPDYVSTAQTWREPSCDWEIFEEASLFGSEERRLFHAGRGICAANSDTPTGGSIVVNVMLDYETLPFIAPRNPYNELIRPADTLPPEGAAGRSVQFVVYGWGRGSLYSSNARTFPLDDTLLGVIAQSRRPFWTTMSDGERDYSTYIQNDRAGIYVIGFPVVTRVDHLINLAELTTLVGLTYVVLLTLAWSVSALGGTAAASGRALLREIRASFYRKLFLAFLAASVLPVMVLALATRTFFELQLESSVQSDAVRVAAVAQRVIEEYVALQERDAGASPSDDIMVWLSRAIDQDVNIYRGPALRATSERDLFDSGLLPERTPGHVYRAIEIDRLSSHVGQEIIGSVPHVLAAAPVRLEEGRAILTVPLALRQQEVDRQIDTLDRRVLLAAVLFALLGAGIGYYMAERIGDPVSRLTRATRRIARGDFSARVAETSSDELRRLVADFNRMAGDLERQRNELQRTHRLEAWAEMARQVAHEIKNPLTPIQLSSEHLMRVNKDKGEPLTPVLEECVTSILSQVKLLRQISAEFSSFASRPTPHPTPTSLAELIPSVVEPYVTGLAGRVTIEVDVPASLPMVVVDRVLLARAITNMMENALHAMPGGGTLTIKAEARPSSVRLSVADTGTGMDPEALRRIFEPYFSTKATGTGLGLTIAKRNVELNGGRIHVESALGRGTTVTIELPVETALTKNGKRRTNRERAHHALFVFRFSIFVHRYRVHVRCRRLRRLRPSMVPPGHQHFDERRQHIPIGQRDERECGMRGHERDEQRDDQQHRVRPPRLQIECLEAAEFDRADHQKRGHENQREHGNRADRFLEARRVRKDHRRGDSRGRRTRHADEVPLVHRSRLNVEPREPHGRGCDVDEPGGPSPVTERRQAPGERQNRRRNAERHDIGERIELQPELAGRPGEARDAAVERVEHHRDADKRRRNRVLATHRVDDARVSTEQVAQRHQAGQQIHAASQPPLLNVGAPPMGT